MESDRFKPIEKFSELQVSPEIMQGVSLLGFDKPFPIQSKALPIALAGKDLIAQAQTGTGKTLVFGVQILNSLPKEGGIAALVIVPTRELAMQVADEMGLYTTDPVPIEAVYGGVAIEPQIDRLRKARVVVGTPGRILDHMERRTIDFSGVGILVLDEVDRMLDMGFIDDIERIVRTLPRERQTLFFSATIPSKIKELGQRYLREPVDVSVGISGGVADKVRQYYVDVKEWNKFVHLKEILAKYEIGVGMIFCRTKAKAQRVGDSLRRAGFLVESIHGDLSQAQRTRALELFRDGKLHLLAATDVAARGLDIENVTHVFNYDMPDEVDTYVHRIGRTARAGKEGVSVTFIAHDDHPIFRKVMDLMGGKVEQLHVTLPPGVGDRPPVGWVEGAPRRGGRGGPRRGPPRDGRRLPRHSHSEHPPRRR